MREEYERVLNRIKFEGRAKYSDILKYYVYLARPDTILGPDLTIEILDALIEAKYVQWESVNSPYLIPCS